MDTQFDLKNSYQESRLFRARALVSIIFIVILLIALLARMAYLQTTTHEKYAALSQGNYVRLSVITPVRGLIFDSNGQVLAENNPSYSLEVIPEQVPDLQATVKALSKIIPISAHEIKRFNKRIKQERRFNSIPIRQRLNEREVALFAVNRHRFRGVEIQARPVRHYPHSELVSHVVGYVAAINEKELKKIDTVNYRNSRFIGKTGVEKSFETELHGFVGYQQTENTARGRTLKTLSLAPPISGNALTTTIDINLQRVAYQALGDLTGAIAAIDTRTGAVRALVSKPGFDSNLFVQGIDHASYNSLQHSAKKPLFNRALRGQYPPGSTLKPFLALAGLEENVISSHGRINCPGYYQLPKQEHKYRDWKKGGHGNVNVHDAIVQSCDVFFYKLAHRLKIDRMHNFLARFGFGSKTGINLLGEKSGLLPSKEWKKRARNQVWFPGETLIAGIGQGFNLTTPLQLANATAIIANRGGIKRPFIVEKINDKAATAKQPTEPQVSLKKPKHWQEIISAMRDVIHGPRGTARRIKIGAQFDMAGKTGTAQVFGVKQNEEYDENKIVEHLKDHALFIAFAPVENPQLAVAVIVENGGHGGSVAAPIARAIFDQYIKVNE
ncbi:MAG: penicillin-binding protein 2 [Cycloclasticus sp. symbiont of Poecilosclerida sp. M]|nr:MAG: penicillin-binding protein 2 [Cycloclasticus sp. symbiont of Poecilosclerida sp. M]